MQTFTASRLTGGNRVFPSKIIIDDQGVTLKNPGLFSGKEKTIPYTRISSINIDCPFVGYSTIIIETTGEGRIQMSGFTKSEVTEMKEIILGKI
ncbi:MAG: PH domain-containing protein [Bacteroidia bacterium]|nr:PH domain-containing protein [Bacteroidia bacterium]